MSFRLQYASGAPLEQTTVQSYIFSCKSEIVLLHVIKTCRAEEVQLHPFLTLAVEAVFSSTSLSLQIRRLGRSTNCIADLVGFGGLFALAGPALPSDTALYCV